MIVADAPPLLPSSVAMGSAEGLWNADQAIAEAARSGKSVLLKNTHLVSSWLSSGLEKKLQTLRPNPHFRLFLTMETSPKVGGNLITVDFCLCAYNEPLMYPRSPPRFSGAPAFS
jgi:dynein heavy chain 1, cytosolic